MNMDTSFNIKCATENDNKQSKNKLAYLKHKPSHCLHCTA